MADIMSIAKDILGKSDGENKEAISKQQLEQDKTKLLEDIAKELKNKVGEEKANILIKDRIEPLLGVSLGVKTRSIGKTIGKGLGVVEKLTGKDMGAKQITESVNQAGEVADQIDGISGQMKEFTSLFSKPTLSGDTNIDTALGEMEEAMNTIKQQKNADMTIYTTGVNTVLGAFLETLTGKSTGSSQAYAGDETPSNKPSDNSATAEQKENLATAGITQDEFKGIVEIYKKEVGDKKGKCLKEVRMMMQTLGDKGMINLPEDKKSGGRASEAKDFGATLKGYAKNGLPQEWQNKQVAVANLEEKHDNVADITNTVLEMKGDVFAFVMRKGNEAGHACLGARVGNEIWIYDNSFTSGNSLSARGIKDHGYILEDYCAARKGSYNFDAVMSLPAQKDQFLAYTEKTYPTGLPNIV